MIKCLTIQIDLSQVNDVRKDDVAKLLRSFNRFPEIDIDPERPAIVSFNLFSDDVQTLWQELEQGVLQSEPMGQWISQHAVIACEGENGWDDYITLWPK